MSHKNERLPQRGPTPLEELLRRENGEKVMADALKLLQIAAGHFDGGRPNQGQGYNLAAQQILDSYCNEFCYGPDRAARAARLPEHPEALIVLGHLEGGETQGHAGGL